MRRAKSLAEKKPHLSDHCPNEGGREKRLITGKDGRKQGGPSQPFPLLPVSHSLILDRTREGTDRDSGRSGGFSPSLPGEKGGGKKSINCCCSSRTISGLPSCCCCTFPSTSSSKLIDSEEFWCRGKLRRKVQKGNEGRRRRLHDSPFANAAPFTVNQVLESQKGF